MESVPVIAPGTFVIILAVTILVSLVAGYAARMFEEKPQAEEKPVSPAETPVLPAEHVALRVLLDKELHWHLEIDGARLEAGEMTPEQRTRLVNILVQIRPWVDGKTVPSPAISATVTQTAPAPPSISLSARLKPPEVDEEEKGKLKLSLGRGFRSLMANDVKVIENTKPPSIVALIDEFLQKRLEVSAFAERDIHLEEGPLGEVIVFVGKTRYASVNDVPDPEIQAMIKAAIKDWEKST
ncbi:MAG: hypothetical protein DDG60_05405 [Anaerolineae bacterium]|nr:MAG: hypothetical protein DDG60_05405 [Anaerolineae bacterium]